MKPTDYIREIEIINSERDKKSVRSLISDFISRNYVVGIFVTSDK